MYNLNFYVKNKTHETTFKKQIIHIDFHEYCWIQGTVLRGSQPVAKIAGLYDLHLKGETLQTHPHQSMYTDTDILSVYHIAF